MMNILSHIDAVSLTTKHFQECLYERHAVDDALSPKMAAKSDTCYNGYKKPHALSTLHKDILNAKSAS